MTCTLHPRRASQPCSHSHVKLILLPTTVRLIVHFCPVAHVPAQITSGAAFGLGRYTTTWHPLGSSGVHPHQARMPPPGKWVIWTWQASVVEHSPVQWNCICCGDVTVTEERQGMGEPPMDAEYTPAGTTTSASRAAMYIIVMPRVLGCFALIVPALALSGQVSQIKHPNLSGTWKLNVDRSGPILPRGTEALTITFDHRDPLIEYSETRTVSGKTTHSGGKKSTIDGRLRVVRIRDWVYDKQ